MKRSTGEMRGFARAVRIWGARLLLVGVAAAVAIGTAGCARADAKMAASPEPMGAGAAAAPAPPPPPPGAPGGGSPSTGGERLLLAANDPGKAKAVSDAHSTAMLIYTATLSMAVYQVEPGLDAVEKIAREIGGYLSVRQDNSITVRVPRDRFDDAVGRIEKIGDVTHRDIKAQDVTDEYVDMQARLKNAYTIRDRLNDLMNKAAVKEALEIEKELGRVTEDIERMEGKLKLLRDQMAFSTITVTFSPLATQQVHDSSLLTPFPWLQEIGLQSLLNVHQ
jgi:hypothetical protein